MANTFTLLDLTTQLRAIGRGVVFYASKWAGSADLTLTHLGDTEGEITVQTNEEYSHLTLPELTGAAKHKSYVSGEDPVVTIPLYFADPALRAIVSPTGNASGGYQRRRPVTERTLVIFPEELFYNAGDDAYGNLVNTSGTWTNAGDALTARQQELLDVSIWFWRGYFTKPALPGFRHEDGGKVVTPVTFQVMQSDLALATIPDGERLYTVGDPADSGITIDVA